MNDLGYSLADVEEAINCCPDWAANRSDASTFVVKVEAMCGELDELRERSRQAAAQQLDLEAGVAAGRRAAQACRELTADLSAARDALGAVEGESTADASRRVVSERDGLSAALSKVTEERDRAYAQLRHVRRCLLKALNAAGPNPGPEARKVVDLLISALDGAHDSKVTALEEQGDG
jgi:hypothetical protein